MTPTEQIAGMPGEIWVNPKAAEGKVSFLACRHDPDEVHFNGVESVRYTRTDLPLGGGWQETIQGAIELLTIHADRLERNGKEDRPERRFIENLTKLIPASLPAPPTREEKDV